MSAASLLQTSWLRRGWLGRLLLPISWLYGALTAMRRVGYRLGWLSMKRLPVPVVVVGNLIAGGAGKTPTTIAVVELLRQRGFTPGIVSRGYGRRSDTIRLIDASTPVHEAGDEPLLMHLRTGVPVAVGADRVGAAHALLDAHPSVDIVISDDGLQHLRLVRDAQVIVFDERGAGNRWLLPAGPLREPMPGQVPARSIVLYNSAAPSTMLPGHLARRGLGGFMSLQDWWSRTPTTVDARDMLRGRTIVAAAGLARPQRFFGMLRDAGLSITELALPDHHDFAALPWPTGTADVIVTEKDAVKLTPGTAGHTRVWVATLDFDPGPAFARELLHLLPSRAEKH